MTAQPPPVMPRMDPPLNVQPFPAQPSPARQPSFRIEPEPGPDRVEDVGPALLEMAQAIARICATRVLLLLALVAASALWSLTTWDPTHLRIIASVGFSVLIVLPLVALYWRKG